MARRRDEVKIDDVRIPVTELTGPQAHDVLEKLKSGYTMTSQDQLMGEKKFPAFVLDMVTAPVKLSDLIQEHDWSPSEYEPVYDKAIEVNDFLSSALQKFQMEMKRLQELEEALNTMGGSGDLLSGLLGSVMPGPKSTGSPT